MRFALLLLSLLPCYLWPQPALDSLRSPQAESGGVLGWAVASLGSGWDGDGVCDLVLGAPGEDVDSLTDAGRVYLFSGATGQPLDTLTSPAAAPSGNFGFALAPARADFNGDTVPDLLVGAPFEPVAGQALAGRVYVFSGADGQLLYSLTSPQAEAQGRFGLALTGLGQDLDGDSVGDWLVAAPFESAPLPEAGRVYLISGADGRLIVALADPTPSVEGHFGRSLTALNSDLDGDGQPDWLAGTWQKPDLPPGAGRVYRFSGADPAPRDSVASPQPQAGGYFGRGLTPAGDLDGDQAPDWWAAAPREAPSPSLSRTGQVYAISGATGAEIYRLASPFVQNFGLFGQALAAVGDLNLDGTTDLLVGAYQERGPTGLAQAGRAYLFSGADGQLLSELGSPYEQGNGFFGFAVASLGSDANGDGLPELIVGAPYERPDASGRVYLFDGRQRNLTAVMGHTSTSFILFPNPSHGPLTLRTQGPPLQQVRLFNLHGAQVWEQRLLPPATELSTSLPNSAPGLYWVEVTSAAGVTRLPWLRH